MRRHIWVTCAALTAVVVGGCGTSGSGTPTTQTSTGSATTSSSATPPPSTSVSRPKTLNMSGVDPCKLIDPGSLPALKIDRPPRPSQESAFSNAPRCGYLVTGMSYFLTAISTAGVDAWSSGPSSVTSLPSIDGFPAAQVLLASQPNRCDVAVDVAPSQQLLATATVSPSFQDRFPKPCDAAQQLAQAAMSTVVRQG